MSDTSRVLTAQPETDNQNKHEDTTTTTSNLTTFAASHPSEPPSDPKPPTLQRSVDNLVKAKTSVQRQVSFNSLARKYGNGYAGQVASNFGQVQTAKPGELARCACGCNNCDHGKEDDLKRVADPNGAGTLQRMPSPELLDKTLQTTHEHKVEVEMPHPAEPGGPAGDNPQAKSSKETDHQPTKTEPAPTNGARTEPLAQNQKKEASSQEAASHRIDGQEGGRPRGQLGPKVPTVVGGEHKPNVDHNPTPAKNTPPPHKGPHVEAHKQHQEALHAKTAEVHKVHSQMRGEANKAKTALHGKTKDTHAQKHEEHKAGDHKAALEGVAASAMAGFGHVNKQASELTGKQVLFAPSPKENPAYYEKLLHPAGEMGEASGSGQGEDSPQHMSLHAPAHSSSAQHTPADHSPRPDPNQLAAQEKQRRIRVENIATTFLAVNAGKSQQILNVASTLPGHIAANAATAKAHLDAAFQTSQATLNSQFAAARSSAQAKASEAHSQLEAKHTATQTAIKTTTQKSLQAVQKARTEAGKKIDQAKAQQIQTLEQIYSSWQGKFKAVGPKIGGEAIQVGNTYAQRYDAQKIHRDDNFWDGPLTDNRAQAREDAAHQVAQQYHDQSIKTADEQASKSLEGKAKDLQTVDELATAGTQMLDQKVTQLQTELQQDETTKLTQLDTAHTTVVKSVDDTLQKTLSSLDSKKSSLLGSMTEAATKSKTGIDQGAASATHKVTSGAQQGAASVTQALSSFASTARGAKAPSEVAMQKAVGQAQGQINTMVSTILSKLNSSVGEIGQALAESAQQGSQSLTTVAQQGSQEAQQESEGLSTAISQIVQAALQNYQQMSQQYESSSQTKVTNLNSELDQIAAAVGKAFQDANGKLDDMFAKAAQGLEDAMRGDMTKNLGPAIEKAAEEAASKVEPRWASVVKIIVAIAIIIVVAVVVGPAVIAAVGAMAGALGASAGAASVIGAIVGGAIVGAGAGAVGQMANNAVDMAAGQKVGLFDGVGQAALTGAITGALGGAGGMLTGKIANVGLRFGADVVMGLGTGMVGSGVAGGILTGKWDFKLDLSPMNLAMTFMGTAVGTAVHMNAAHTSTVEPTTTTNTEVTTTRTNTTNTEVNPAGGEHTNPSPVKTTEPTTTSEPTKVNSPTDTPAPIEPTKTGGSTEPTNTEPTKVNNPTEPTGTEPTKPTSTTEPTNTEPTKPGSTTEPTKPTNTEPTNTEPTKPTSAEPTNTEPNKAAGSTEPTQTKGGVTEPTNTEPTSPEQSAQPGTKENQAEPNQNQEGDKPAAKPKPKKGFGKNNSSDIPDQGKVSKVEGAPDVDAAKQGKHVKGHPNNTDPGRSRWAERVDHVTETQKAWVEGDPVPGQPQARSYDTGKVIGENGETWIKVHQAKDGAIHGVPIKRGGTPPAAGPEPGDSPAPTKPSGPEPTGGPTHDLGPTTEPTTNPERGGPINPEANGANPETPKSELHPGEDAFKDTPKVTESEYTNSEGENHKLKVLEDGRLVRCSVCTDMATSLKARVAALPPELAELPRVNIKSLETQLEKFSQQAKKLAAMPEDSPERIKDEQKLQRHLEALDQGITNLVKSYSQRSTPRLELEVQTKLLKIMHEEGGGLYSDPRAIKGQETIESAKAENSDARPTKKQRTGKTTSQSSNRDNPLPGFNENDGGLGSVREIRQSVTGDNVERGRGNARYTEIGGQTTIDNIAPYGKPGVGNVFVRELGAYPEIAGEIATIKENNPEVTDATIAQALATMKPGTTLTDVFGVEAPALGRLSRLLQVEGARGDAAIVGGPMVLDLIISEKMTFADAFNIAGFEGGGGMYPSSQKGAVAGMRGVEKEIGYNSEDIPTRKTRPNKRTTTEHGERQVELGTIYAQYLMEISGKYKPADINNPAKIAEYINSGQMQTDLRQQMADHYFNR